MKLVLLSCLAMLGFVVAEQPVVLCGRQLAKARVLLCYGAEYVDKRNSHLSLYPYLEADEDNWDEDLVVGGRRGSLSAPWSRYKRDGLVDECCLKPCTTDVILNYC